MAEDSSTVTDGHRGSPHRFNNGPDCRVTVELSARSPVQAEAEEGLPTGGAALPNAMVAPGPPPVSGVETEFRNLLAFKGLAQTKENLCRVALEDWQSTADLMGKRVDKKAKEVRSIRNEIYQVVGFYSAFQGLLLTAVAQSNLLHWNNRGYPLALSAFATSITATGVVQKNLLIGAWKKSIKSEDPTRKTLLSRVETLRRDGIKFTFQDQYEDEVKVKPTETIWTFLFTYENLVVATLITFGGLCLASMLQILRHPGCTAQC